MSELLVNAVDEKFCSECRTAITAKAEICPKCGVRQIGQPTLLNITESIPDGVRGWSWGAFFLSWIWAIGNRTWIGLLAIIPYVGFIMAIVLGFKGREWAWKAKKWESVKQFNRVQRKWSYWSFGIVVTIILVRLFLFEPFKIPSGAMIPTLQVGDYILVNKLTYGIRADSIFGIHLPFSNIKLLQINNPQRGDVMVFRYPENPTLDYIKRVVGLPGDTVEYRNKRLWINGVEQAQQADGDYNYVETGLNFVHTEKRLETLGERKHAVLINPEMPTLHLASVVEFSGRENCSYDHEMVRCKVPAGQFS